MKKVMSLVGWTLFVISCFVVIVLSVLAKSRSHP